MDLRIGERIKALRLASELTQAELADRAKLTKGFISQLENDQTSISVDSLADLLGALGVSMADFFADVEDTKNVFGPDDRVPFERKGASRFEVLVPGSTNNLMDPILLELEPGESLDQQGPLPGEQFGYVLKGTATLMISRKAHRIPTDHCFYFSSDREHQIRNDGTERVKMVWVTSPPLM
ncbi:helix-turn-helix domain-containing protein [candidate division GN15 bacterium]|nr:helix-turn-helix domain-containing protein [candidate division GN15 bacterium]